MTPNTQSSAVPALLVSASTTWYVSPNPRPPTTAMGIEVNAPNAAAPIVSMSRNGPSAAALNDVAVGPLKMAASADRPPATPHAMRLTRLTEMPHRDRKSTRLNSSHVEISYAVFCLKKKKKRNKEEDNQ